MKKRHQHEYAAKLLDRLMMLDAEVHGAFYEMGQILSALEHGNLWDVLGYDSFANLIDEELSISTSQAYRYLHTFRHFRRLGYNKTESLALMAEFSFTHMSKVLPSVNQKIGKRAIGNAIGKMLEQSKQINFQLNSTDLSLLVKVLQKYGAEPTDTGRLMNSSGALMELVRAVEARPQLKAVS
jgi:hypothetical protein